MLRKLLFVAMSIAMFTVLLGNTDAQARHCRNRHNNDGCYKNSHHSRDNCGYKIYRRGKYGHGCRRHGACGHGSGCGYGNTCHQHSANYTTTNSCHYR